MGGPNICITSGGKELFLDKYPFIDFYIKNEGEITFSDLARELNNNSFNLDEIKKGGKIYDDVCYKCDGEYYEH